MKLRNGLIVSATALAVLMVLTPPAQAGQYLVGGSGGRGSKPPPRP